MPVQGKLGSWDFKSKRQQGVFCPEGMCRAHMFALAVTEQLETWPEQARHRQWVSVSLLYIMEYGTLYNASRDHL